MTKLPQMYLHSVNGPTGIIPTPVYRIGPDGEGYFDNLNQTELAQRGSQGYVTPGNVNGLPTMDYSNPYVRDHASNWQEDFVMGATPTVDANVFVQNTKENREMIRNHWRTSENGKFEYPGDDKAWRIIPTEKYGEIILMNVKIPVTRTVAATLGNMRVAGGNLDQNAMQQQAIIQGQSQLNEEIWGLGKEYTNEPEPTTEPAK
jgi:hypothetical protein